MNQVEAVWHAADTWQRLILVALVVASLVQTHFVIRYAPRPWWSVAPGRAIMLKSATLLAALWLTLVNAFWVYPFEEQITALVMWAIAAAVIYQWQAFLRSPRNRS